MDSCRQCYRILTAVQQESGVNEQANKDCYQIESMSPQYLFANSEEFVLMEYSC